MIELVDVDFETDWQKGTPGSRMDEAVRVQPLNAMMHGHDGTLAAFGPDAAEAGLQAEAMVIFGPEFDRDVQLVASPTS